MSDLISRQAAIHAISVYMKGYKEHIGKPDDSEVFAHARGLLVSIESSINALPSAEPKKGRWIERHYIGSRTVTTKICSNCRSEYSYDAETGVSDYNFCPNCGADMRGEADE